MKVATHNGFFHADDVFAVAVLKLAGLVEEVIRTRDPETLATSDIRVDVGRKYNPKTGDFDHHQDGGAGKRANGIPYAAFGLIWKEYGTKVAGSIEAAELIDRKFIQLIDADDNGMNLFEPKLVDVLPISIARELTLFNPFWDEKPTEADFDQAFDKIVDLAIIFFKREIANAHSKLAGNKRVLAAAKKGTDPRVLVLDEELPWRDITIEQLPQVQFVVYPRVEGSWSVQAVPKRAGGFENRFSLPAVWAGKVNDELAKVTGVPDAFFCHNARFVAVAKTKASALKLAAMAIT